MQRPRNRTLSIRVSRHAVWTHAFQGLTLVVSLLANMEINKIFVRNLHPACSKEELHELFSPFGTIKDVRLVHKL